jgi:hypothetical protein
MTQNTEVNANQECSNIKKTYNSLTISDRVAIRKKWNLKKKNHASLRMIGKKYGVSHEQVRLIIVGIAPKDAAHSKEIIHDFELSRKHTISVAALAQEFGVSTKVIEEVVC